MIEQPSALITGASRGIGRAIALEMANRGYAVGVNYVRSKARADEVVEQIIAAGGLAVALTRERRASWWPRLDYCSNA